MANRKLAVFACFAVAAVCVVVAIAYFAQTASHLPSFLPGHQAGSTRHHIKHGIAAVAVAVVAVLGAWMLTGPAGDRR
jgi:amino acid permease